jgi:hypothetical protein
VVPARDRAATKAAAQSTEGNKTMIRNLKKAFGVSLLAALTFSAVHVMGASAIDPGVNNHFTSDAVNTKFDLTVATGTPHNTTFTAYGATIECHHTTYSVHHKNTTTFTALTVTSEVTGCTSGESVATVHMNGCHYEFTAKNSAATHATVHLRCPVGKKIEWTTPNGTIKYGPQTPTKGGVTYSTIEMSGKHALTINETIEGTHGECHGACQIFGTTTTSATVKGSMTLQATDTVTGLPVNLTAT